MDDEEKIIFAIEQKQIEFCENAITTVRLDDGVVYVPILPICEFFGITWAAQYKRIKRDSVLSNALKFVPVSQAGLNDSDLIFLPLDVLHRWLFVINVNTVKKSLQDSLIHYQRECYQMFSDAFDQESPPNSPQSVELAKIRDIGLGVARIVEQKMEIRGDI